MLRPKTLLKAKLQRSIFSFFTMSLLPHLNIPREAPRPAWGDKELQTKETESEIRARAENAGPSPGSGSAGSAGTESCFHTATDRVGVEESTGKAALVAPSSLTFSDGGMGAGDLKLTQLQSSSGKNVLRADISRAEAEASNHSSEGSTSTNVYFDVSGSESNPLTTSPALSAFGAQAELQEKKTKQAGGNPENTLAALKDIATFIGGEALTATAGCDYVRLADDEGSR
jgi:hypothetical protein